MLTLIVIGLVGGLITGISPCVLPVLPAIFLAGGAQSARTSMPVPANTGSLAVAANPQQSLGRRPFLVVAGLVVSFSVFTLLGSLILSALHLPALRRPGARRHHHRRSDRADRRQRRRVDPRRSPSAPRSRC